MLERAERIRIILTECEKFSKVANPTFNILNDLHELLVSEMTSDMQNIYGGVSNVEIKEDIKILLEHLNDEATTEFKELVVEVIVKLLKIVAETK